MTGCGYRVALPPIIPTYDRGRTIRHWSMKRSRWAAIDQWLLSLGSPALKRKRSESWIPSCYKAPLPGRKSFSCEIAIGNGAIAELLGPEERQPARHTPRAH